MAGTLYLGGAAVGGPPDAQRNNTGMIASYNFDELAGDPAAIDNDLLGPNLVLSGDCDFNGAGDATGGLVFGVGGDGIAVSATLGDAQNTINSIIGSPLSGSQLWVEMWITPAVNGVGPARLFTISQPNGTGSDQFNPATQRNVLLGTGYITADQTVRARIATLDATTTDNGDDLASGLPVLSGGATDSSLQHVVLTYDGLATTTLEIAFSGGDMTADDNFALDDGVNPAITYRFGVGLDTSTLQYVAVAGTLPGTIANLLAKMASPTASAIKNWVAADIGSDTIEITSGPLSGATADVTYSLGTDVGLVMTATDTTPDNAFLYLDNALIDSSRVKIGPTTDGAFSGGAWSNIWPLAVGNELPYLPNNVPPDGSRHFEGTVHFLGIGNTLMGASQVGQNFLAGVDGNGVAPAPRVQFAPGDATGSTEEPVSGSVAGTATVTISQAQGFSVQIPYTIAAGSPAATIGSDVASADPVPPLGSGWPGTNVVTIDAGTTTGTINFSVFAGALDSAAPGAVERFTLTLHEPIQSPAATLGSQPVHNHTITDPAAPPAPAGTRPGPTNTGTTGTLTASPGFTVTSPGLVENLDITGRLNINVDDVTVRNCRVDADHSNYGIVINNSAANTLIEDCEVTNFDSQGIIQTAGGTNTVVRRVNVHDGGGDGVQCNFNATFENCWFHHLGRRLNSHADGTQLQQGNNVSFFQCFFDMPNRANPDAPADIYFPGVGVTNPAPGGNESQIEYQTTAYLLPVYKADACFRVQTRNGPSGNYSLDQCWVNGSNYTFSLQWSNDVDQAHPNTARFDPFSAPNSGAWYGPPNNITVTNCIIGDIWRWGALNSGIERPTFYNGLTSTWDAQGNLTSGVLMSASQPDYDAAMGQSVVFSGNRWASRDPADAAEDFYFPDMAGATGYITTNSLGGQPAL